MGDVKTESMGISERAYVDPKAELGRDVVVEPFAYIAGNVKIGEGCWIGPHAVILEGAELGYGCRVFPSAVVGAIPQDLKFKGEKTRAIVGARTTIREAATVNRGTASRGETRVGADCLIMAYSHVAHDCVIGDHVILGNSTQIAGEVEVDDYAILSGGTLVHQFTRIGCHVMVQGGSRVTKDVPPYVLAGRDPLTFMGLNLVGLRRRGFSIVRIQELQEAYRLLYRDGLNITQALDRIVAEVLQSEELNTVLEFVRSSERGVIRGGRSD